MVSSSPGDTQVSSDTASSNLGKNLGVSFDISYGETSLGRLSAGMLGLIVIGLMGFYVLTRSHQA